MIGAKANVLPLFIRGTVVKGFGRGSKGLFRLFNVNFKLFSRAGLPDCEFQRGRGRQATQRLAKWHLFRLSTRWESVFVPLFMQF